MMSSKAGLHKRQTSVTEHFIKRRLKTRRQTSETKCQRRDWGERQCSSALQQRHAEKTVIDSASTEQMSRCATCCHQDRDDDGAGVAAPVQSTLCARCCRLLLLAADE